MPAIAAVDVGSNAIRLVVLEVGGSGHGRHLEQQRYALRLGTDVFGTGAISTDTLERMLTVFTDIAARLHQHGVTCYRAVGTSALRDARNTREVVETLRRTTGISLEVIDGREETRLMRDALLREVDAPRRGMLLIDLGGGSLELERLPGRRSLSLPLGTVRLLHRYPVLQEPLSAEAISAIGLEIECELRQALHRRRPCTIGVGTGGNLDALGRLVPVVDRPCVTIDVGRLEALAVEAGALTMGERGLRYGLRPDRADLVLPAALVVLALSRVVGLHEILVPGTGLRQALLYELAASLGITLT